MKGLKFLAIIAIAVIAVFSGNAALAQSPHQEILSQGGSREAAELFEAFRGRKPSVEPLLRHCGIDIEDAA